MIVGPDLLITLERILNHTAATLSSQAHQRCAASEVWEYLTNVKQGGWFTDRGIQPHSALNEGRSVEHRTSKWNVLCVIK